MTIAHDLTQPHTVAALFARCGLRASMRCALAVSGGSDSTALMLLFAGWLRQSGQEAGRHTVLTVDHGLRAGSAAEAQEVAAQAALLGFQYATLEWEGPKPSTGIQAAARSARYQLMGAYMRANGVAVLLTGHTRDDRAETLLMRLARGSGLDGLAGMSPRLGFRDLGLCDLGLDDMDIARPLLEVSRAQLRSLLQARGIGWIDDPSNQAQEFERPRLRAARAHLDELGLNDAMLTLSATRLLRARRGLERAVDDFCAPASGGAVSVDPSGYILIDRSRLQALEEEIALRVLRRSIVAAGGEARLVSLAKFESLAASVWAAGAEPGKWTLARAMVTLREDAITIEREPGRAPLPRLQLAAGAQAYWDGRFRIKVGATTGSGLVEVRPLGEDAARDFLKSQDGSTTRPPLNAAALAPSFWQGDRLRAAPTIGFWANQDDRGALEAEFIWAARGDL